MCITSMQFVSIVANSRDSNEEEYYGCSDITIRNSRPLSSPSTPIHHTTKTNGGFIKQITTIVQTITPENRPPSPRPHNLVTESISRCRAIAVNWKGIPTFDYWCNSQCKGSICPSNLKSYCLCVWRKRKCIISVHLITISSRLKD